MPANYPSSIKTFVTKEDGRVVENVIFASHINTIQDEVTAIETELGTDVSGAYADLKTRLSSMSSIPFLSSVRGYGAKGDGVTDDTVAFSDAIADNANKALYMPAGTYIISNYLVLTANMSLFGEGRGATILKQITPATRGIYASGNNIRISNFTLQGHASPVTSMSKTAAIAAGEYTVSSNAISGGNYSGLTVDNMIIRNWGSLGITTGGNSDGLLFVNNIFENLWDEGVLVGDDPVGLTQSRNIIIQGNIFRNCFKNAVDVNGYNILINNNQVLNCGQDTEGMDIHGILVYTSRGKMDVNDVTITDNQVHQAGGTGIRVQCIRVDATQTTTTASISAGTDVVIPVASITGFAIGDAVSVTRGAVYELTTLTNVGASTLTATLVNGYNTGAVVKLVSEINNVNVSDNNVTDVGQITSTSPNIMIDADSSGPALLRYALVSDNILDTAPRDNILLSGVSHVDVQNNMCRNAGRYGVYIYKTSHFSVNDNRIIGATEHAIYSYQTSHGQINENKIYETNPSFFEINVQDSEDIMLHGNKIFGQGQRGINLNPGLRIDCEGFSVIGNQIYNTTIYGIVLAVNAAVSTTTSSGVTAGLNVLVGIADITGLTAGSPVLINDGINSETTTILTMGASAFYADLVNNYTVGAVVTRAETAINNSVIAANTIDNCGVGVSLFGTADNNNIHGNMLLNNTTGLYIASSTANKNKVYGNNFSGNALDMDLRDPYSSPIIAEQGSGVYQTITNNANTIALQGFYKVIRVTGSGGVKVLTSTPTISVTSAVLGQEITVYGGSGDTVTLQDEAVLTGSKLKLRDRVRVVGQYTTLTLMYDGVYWVETKSPVDKFIAITGATPDVSNSTRFKITQSGAVTITNFTGGISGQEILIVFGDANSTVDFTASTLKGHAGIDWTPATNDSMRCAYDGVYWYCAVSDNTA